MRQESRERFSLAAVISTLLSTALVSIGDDWPQFRGLERDARSAEIDLMEKWPTGGPKLLWTANNLGQGYSQPVIADGFVYVTGMLGDKGYLSALDLNGTLKWAEPYGKEWTKSYPGARCTPTVNEGSVYIVSSLGELVCKDAKTGSTRWKRDVMTHFGGDTGRFGFIESLLIDGPRVICTAGASNAVMVALHKETGREIWKTGGLNDAAAYCSPLLIEQGTRRLIVTMTSHHVIGVEADSGELLWREPFHNPYGQNPNTPVYSDGMLFVTSGDKVGSMLLRLSDGGATVVRQWSQPALDCHYGNVLELGGYVYASAHQNSRGWVCLELASGKVMFKTRIIKNGMACYADGMMYCYGVDGRVSLVKPGTGGFEVLGSFDVESGTGQHFAHLSVSDGRLYVRHGDALMVYDIRADQ